MDETHEILVRLLACQAAAYFGATQARATDRHLAAAEQCGRHQASGFILFQPPAGTGGAAVRSWERQVDDLARDGFLRIERRSKGRGIALTWAGVSAAGSVAGFPLEDALELMGMIDRHLQDDAGGPYVPPASAGLWAGLVPDWMLAGLAPWWGGFKVTEADKTAMARVFLRLVPAIGAGWIRINASVAGLRWYGPTDAGRAALASPPAYTDAVEPDEAAGRYFFESWNAELDRLEGARPVNSNEVFQVPVPATAWWRVNTGPGNRTEHRNA